MSRKTFKSVSLALATTTLLAGCNQLEAIETGGSGGSGGGGVPPAVREALEASCGKSGCHSPGATLPILAGDEIDGILTGEINGVPLVTLGDTVNSYLAIVMLPDVLLSSLGLTRTVPRMPADNDFLNPNNQVILSWIAGAEFEGGGPATTGGVDTDTDTGGTDTTGEPAEPTFANVQAIIDASCSCHFSAASAANGNLSLPMGDSYAALVDVKSPSVALDLVEPSDPAASYLYLKLAGGFEDEGGAGTLMPPPMGLMDDAKLALIEAWIAGGALED
ncbi:hypothetical protein [Nannocystis bainbridge]|uniref:Cytochrome C Planctomycete-type domain-containing protein n=1 Tax=Nannocystis bainbridge TaxID=2995303 RepID=A0ABT5E9U8_9BACT|nr:hypothetical protein [Nannocystis bainbridge]MDC0722210.1 hypothetical protein [Nannocystis bainbridge]